MQKETEQTQIQIKADVMLLTALILLPMTSISAAEQAVALKPNILLIVSDDQGYADLGFQGCKDIPTPHLDRLASEGIRFSSGYVTHPFCSPSRAGLLTGRYQRRFRYDQNPHYDPNDHREGLPTGEKLLPEFLRRAGYVTGWVGKWDFGAAREYHPEGRGFMETFGFIGGGHHYINWKPAPTAAGPEYNEPIERNGQPVAVTNHLTVAFGDEGAAFVRRHKNEPWFLYLAFNAPHIPLEPTPERLARFKSIADPKRRKYAAQVSLLDDAVGTVLEALRGTGQEKRTLVVFFSDNGGPQGANWNGSSNLPLRGGKGTLYEGGIRVPLVMSWPGKLPVGRTYELPVSSLDVFPTALALAGEPMPTNTIYDGVNLLPFLTGANSNAPHDKLFWRMGGGSQFAAREGEFKLIRSRGQPDELYNLADDIGEKNNLAGGLPDKLKKLEGDMNDWNQQMVPGHAANPKDRKQLVEP